MGMSRNKMVITSYIFSVTKCVKCQIGSFLLTHVAGDNYQYYILNWQDLLKTFLFISDQFDWWNSESSSPSLKNMKPFFFFSMLLKLPVFHWLFVLFRGRFMSRFVFWQPETAIKCFFRNKYALQRLKQEALVSGASLTINIF